MEGSRSAPAGRAGAAATGRGQLSLGLSSAAGAALVRSRSTGPGARLDPRAPSRASAAIGATSAAQLTVRATVRGTVRSKARGRSEAPQSPRKWPPGQSPGQLLRQLPGQLERPQISSLGQSGHFCALLVKGHVRAHEEYQPNHNCPLGGSRIHQPCRPALRRAGRADPSGLPAPPGRGPGLSTLPVGRVAEPSPEPRKRRFLRGWKGRKCRRRNSLTCADARAHGCAKLNNPSYLSTLPKVLPEGRVIPSVFNTLFVVKEL